MLDLSMLGTPVRIGGANVSADTIEVITDAVPDGRTWVLLGVDWVASASGASAILGSIFTPLGFTLWQGWADLGTTQFGGGLQWRGAYPLLPGETCQLLASVTPLGTGCGATAWGVALPFVAF
jgi:hypothetical protein